MQQARRAWNEAAPGWDVERLVFLDETGAATNMARSYGRASQGLRCFASAPLGHWQTTTFVAALRHQRLTAPMLTDGPMDGEVFLAYVHNFLCPSLLPGDIVVLDNLSSQQGRRRPRSDRGCGCQPALSAALLPDLNPIEKLFAKLKALLRKAAARNTDALWAEIGRLLDRFPPSECANYFASSGYVST